MEAVTARAPHARGARPAPLTLLVALVLLVAGGGGAARAPAAPAWSCGNESNVGAELGRLAYLRAGALHLLDLASCRDRILARRASAPVRFSADGRWVAFGAGRVVSAAGGTVLRPLAAAGTERAWDWAPGRALVAGATAGGGVLLGGPGVEPRRLLPEGWGASGLRFANDGSLIVARSLSRRRQEVSVLSPPGWRPRLVYRVPPGQFSPPSLAGLSPDRRWLLYWPRPQNSNSLAADGLALHVRALTPSSRSVRLTRAMLAYDDFLSWCGRRLVFADGAWRVATSGKRLRVASPPAWRTRDLSADRTRSWVSPSCSPDGRLVAASAGRNYVEPRFGLEHRSIWLLAVDGSSRRRLTEPRDRNTSDESPRWTRDGRAILFWRTRSGGRGELYAVRPGGGRPFGPLAYAGPVGNYYGHYGWASAFDLR